MMRDPRGWAGALRSLSDAGESLTESQYPWDYLTVVAKVPASEAFRPPGAGGCTLAAP